MKAQGIWQVHLLRMKTRVNMRNDRVIESCRCLCYISTGLLWYQVRSYGDEDEPLEQTVILEKSNKSNNLHNLLTSMILTKSVSRNESSTTLIVYKFVSIVTKKKKRPSGRSDFVLWIDGIWNKLQECTSEGNNKAFHCNTLWMFSKNSKIERCFQ